MYRCGFCGKEHDKLEDRVVCESACFKKYQADEEARKQNEYQVKRKQSADAIYAEFDKVEKMIKDHIKEYKTLDIHKQYPYLKYVFDRTIWWF